MFDRPSVKLQFSDPARERRFRAVYDRAYVTQFRLAVSLGLAVVLLDILMDRLAAPEMSAQANRVRIALVLPVLVAGWAGSYLPAVRRGYQPFATVWAAAAGLALVAALLAAGRDGWEGLVSPVGFLSFVFIEVYGLVLLGLRIQYGWPLGVAFCALYVLVLARFADLPTARLVYYAFHLAAATGLAMLLAWGREKLVRRNFEARSGPT